MQRLLLSLLLLTPTIAQARLTGFLPLDQAHAEFFSSSDLAELGDSIAFVGDINGDGFDDALFGAYINGDGGFQAGKVYLLMGREGGYDGTFLLDQAAHATFLGEGSSAYAGSSLASAGDLDGDGFDDFLIGARGAQIDAGWVYLFYGRADFPTGTLDLGDADAVFKGRGSGDSAGIALGGVGDLNADGLPDLAFGAPKEDQGSRNTGSVHLFFGIEGRFSGSYPVNLSDAVIRGTLGGDELGTSLAGGQDVDGDGYDDLVVGAPRADPLSRPDAGAVFLFRGGPGFPTGTIPLSDAEVTFAGEATQHFLGNAVDLVPDVDGDGRAEILAGAVRHSGAGANAGMAYLIPGRAGGTWPLSVISAQAFDSFSGEAEQDSAGTAVAGLGDLDGDGLGEFLITAPLFDGDFNNTGRSALFYGALPWPGFTPLSGAPAGFDGSVDSQLAGTALGKRGDMDGDGYPDILIGSSALGQVHLLLMGRFIDQDKDGQRVVDGDCDDHAPLIGAGFLEICQPEGDDPIDNDCDGGVDEGCDEPTPTPETPTEASPTPTTGSPTPGTPTEETPTGATPTGSPPATPTPTGPTPALSPTPSPGGGSPTLTPADPTPTRSPGETTPTRTPAQTTPTATPGGPTPTPGGPTPTPGGPTPTPRAPTPTPDGPTPSDVSPTPSHTDVGSPSPTDTGTETPGASPSVASPSPTPVPDPTPSLTPLPSPTPTLGSGSPTPSAVRTPTPRGETPTQTPTHVVGPTATPSPTQTAPGTSPTATPTGSPTPTLTPTMGSPSPTPTPSAPPRDPDDPLGDSTQEVIYAPVPPWVGGGGGVYIPPRGIDDTPTLPPESPTPAVESPTPTAETGGGGKGSQGLQDRVDGCACAQGGGSPLPLPSLLLLGAVVALRPPRPREVRPRRSRP